MCTISDPNSQAVCINYYRQNLSLKNNLFALLIKTQTPTAFKKVMIQVGALLLPFREACVNFYDPILPRMGFLLHL